MVAYGLLSALELTHLIYEKKPDYEPKQGYWYGSLALFCGLFKIEAHNFHQMFSITIAFIQE